MDSEFKEKFRYYCRKSRFKQKELAIQLNVVDSAVSRWVNGDNVFPKDYLVRMCELFKLNESERREMFALAERLTEQIKLKRESSQDNFPKGLKPQSEFDEEVKQFANNAEQRRELPGSLSISVTQFGESSAANHYLRMLVVLPEPLTNQSGDCSPSGRTNNIRREWQCLREAIEQSGDVLGGGNVPWATVRLVPPTAEGLRDALSLRHPGYQVIHISCQGSREGLLLEDALGRERLLSIAQLVDAFYGKTVKLVVLNAGATLDLGEALVERAGVPCVIATQQPLNEGEASILNEKLYRHLARRASVDEALKEVRLTIVEQIETGDLLVEGDSQDRIGNLVLFGNKDLRLDAQSPVASQPLFILDPTPHYGLPLHLLTGFVGRNSELLKLAKWFASDSSCIFAITGIGGLGKTSLVVNAALRNGYRFGTIIFVSADETPDLGPREVLQKLNNALRLASTPDEVDDPTGALGRRLNHHAVLLILDNLESLSPTCTRQLTQVLQNLDPRGSSRVLMTLRPHEQGKLTALARGNRITLSVLARTDALRLAWEESVHKQVRLTEQNYDQPLPPDLAKLANLARDAHLPDIAREEVALLDELVTLAFLHPKMIQLAVATLSEYDWKETYLRLVRLRGQEIEEALQNYIGQVVDDLVQRTPESMDVLHAMLAFAGSAAASHLGSVVLGKEISDDSLELIDFTEEWLYPIVRTNLLRYDDRRYELDPPVRGYLEQKRPLDAARRNIYQLRHAEAHLNVIADYERAIDEERMTYTAPPEWSNVMAAFRWLTSADIGDEKCTRLFLAYVRYGRNVFVYNYDPHLLPWLKAALKAAKRLGDQQIQAQILLTSGRVQCFHDLYDEALSSFGMAITLCEAIGDRQILADVLRGIGEAHRLRDDAGDTALKNFEAALVLYRALGDRMGEASTLWSIGQIQQGVDNDEAALANYNAALTISQGIGDLAGEADALSSIGDIQRSRRELDAAKANCRRALALYQTVGDRLGEAETLYSLGDVYCSRGETDDALASYELSLKIHQEIGMECSTAHLGIGNVWRLQGKYTAALASYTIALAICREDNDHLTEAHVLWSMGEIQRLQGRYDEASSSYDTARTLYRMVATPLGEANTLAAQGQLALINKDQAESERLFTEAINTYRAMNRHASIAETIAGYGWTLLGLGHNDRAYSYLEHAADLFDELGLLDEARRHRQAITD